jgi:transcriptional regulator GlxA family with amidase domain
LSRLLQAQKSWTSRFDQLQEWIQDHLAEPITVEAMARFSGMSERHFARLFNEEKGVTPARFVEEIRVEAAKRMLQDSRAGLKEVADRCGFGSADTMRRSFRRITGGSPLEFAEASRAQRKGSDVRAEPAARGRRLD